MLIHTENLALEDKIKLETLLNTMGVHFTSDKENEILRYQDKLKEEYESIIYKTNLFNVKMINLLVKAAIPQKWIGNDNVFEFHYYSTIKNFDNETTSSFFDNTNYEVICDVTNQEEIENLLTYIADNLELNYDFTFSDYNDDFSFDSEQDKIIQIF